MGHSFSRAYFNEMFAEKGIAGRYDNYALPDLSALPDVIAGTRELCGFNVTIPHKRAVMDLLDDVDDEARAIGAVNTVTIDRRGDRPVTCGHNTDAGGFRLGFAALLQGACAGEVSPRALVLGTGGASRAVTYALGQMGVHVTHVSRNPGAGRITYAHLTKPVMDACRIIVNTTPLGTYPATDGAAPIPYGLVTPRHVCLDLVYNPAVTEFMSRCAARGAAVQNGLAMLHAQAQLAWDYFSKQVAINNGKPNSIQ